MALNLFIFWCFDWLLFLIFCLYKMQVQNVDSNFITDQKICSFIFRGLLQSRRRHCNERNAASTKFSNLGKFQFFGWIFFLNLPESNESVIGSRCQKIDFRRILYESQTDDGRAVNLLNLLTFEMIRVVGWRKYVNISANVSKEMTHFLRRWASHPVIRRRLKFASLLSGITKGWNVGGSNLFVEVNCRSHFDWTRCSQPGCDAVCLNGRASNEILVETFSFVHRKLELFDAAVFKTDSEVNPKVVGTLQTLFKKIWNHNSSLLSATGISNWNSLTYFIISHLSS